jgi:selenocysteine lyase/cysteine desulfurase
VRPDAQKTDAIQTNKNLILSREALVNSTPALEILADDVKCKHGSTTGQLDAGPLLPALARHRGGDAPGASDLCLRRRGAERIRASVRSAVERELASVGSPHPAVAASPLPTPRRPVTAQGGSREHRRRPRAGLALRRRGGPARLSDLSRTVYGKPLVYLDNAASAAEAAGRDRRRADVYEHWLRATSIAASTGFRSHAHRRLRDGAREGADFIHAGSAEEIIFVARDDRGRQPRRADLRPRARRSRRRVLITGLEHHSNIVPWQLLCEEKGATLSVVRLTDSGEVNLDSFERLLSPKTRIVAIAHLSNALGTVLPVAEIVKRAHARKIPSSSTARKPFPRMPVDVQALDCDFYAFSSHKIYGPSGVGVLYGKAELLEAMPPYQGGGDMIRSVTFEKTTFNTLPYKFEAGTPNIAGGIAFGAALDYVTRLGLRRSPRTSTTS